MYQVSPSTNIFEVGGGTENSSVLATFPPAVPPNANVVVEGAGTAPAPLYLAVPRSATSVHVDPFQFSVAPVAGGPPVNANPAVVVPEPDNSLRAVFTSVISVHEEPSYCSTSLETDGSAPATAKAAVCIPNPAK